MGVIAVLAIAAFGVIVLRQGGGPAASPALVAAASPTRPVDRPPATAAPTDTQAAAPTETTEPTSAPTSRSTAAATPAPEESSVPAASCRNDDVGVTVLYPAAWFAYSGDATWKCLLVDPNPIEVTAQSELPDVAVRLVPIEEAYATVLAGEGQSAAWTLLRSGETTIDGRPATVFEEDSTGDGFYAVGVRRYAFIVDRGAGGALIIETVGRPGDTYFANAAVVDLVAGAVHID